MILRGFEISLLHNFSIAIDTSSTPCALLAFSLDITFVIASSEKSTLDKILSVLDVKTGRLLPLSRGRQMEAKYELKIVALSKKLVTNVLLSRRGGMLVSFLLLSSLLKADQKILLLLLGLLSLSLRSFMYDSFAKSMTELVSIWIVWTKALPSMGLPLDFHRSKTLWFLLMAHLTSVLFYM